MLKELIKNAKKEIVKNNKEFEYTAGDLEIAAQVWHGYLTPLQRASIMKQHGITKSINDCYRAIKGMF
ncbi:hypothetical protein [Proteus phage vB_PmiP_RS10pmA]|nr:hypothetical protein [Proteus phage vB_PmiP_RS10pmA]